MNRRSEKFYLLLAFWIPVTAMPFHVEAKTKNLKIHGYVTEVTSPTVFSIEDYRVHSDRLDLLEFENLEKDPPFNGLLNYALQ